MKVLMKAVIAILIIILVPALAYFLFLCWLTLVEYRPDAIEIVEPVHNERTIDSTGDSYTIVTWNIGYAALGDNADFFMDGLIADIWVQSKISDARKQCDDAIHKVSMIRGELVNRLNG